MSTVLRGMIGAGFVAMILACGGNPAPVVSPTAVPAPDAVPTAPLNPVAPVVTAYDAKFNAWAEAQGAAGGFALRMPTPTEDTVESLDTPMGAASTHTFGASSEDPVGYFMVSTTDYPAGFVALIGVEGALDSARDGMVQGSNGTLMAEDKITVAGQSARRFRINAVTEGISLIMVGQMFILGDRIYIIAVSTNDVTVNDWADSWLKTFRLI